jgi:hypothetical protein
MRLQVITLNSAGRMYFVPEGRHDSSQARSAVAQKGLENSAQGFKRGNRRPRAVRPEGAADRTY